MAGPAVFIRKPGGFGTRLGGYGMSHKIWTCLACRAWHEKKKPPCCERCGGKSFLHYDSHGEARWFVGLMRELDAGNIEELEHHPRYPIHVALVPNLACTTRVFEYVADAEYVRAGMLITADFKPKAEAGLDPVFKLKQRCFEAAYGRKINIVTER